MDVDGRGYGVGVLWAQAITEMTKQLCRTRVQTHLYQCDEEDSREQEMRREARLRQRQQQKVELGKEVGIATMGKKVRFG